MSEGPFKSALDQLPSQGVFQHTLITYRYRGSNLIKETRDRVYQYNGDYIDSYTSQPIGKGSSV